MNICKMSNVMYKVSVIIPIYKVEKHIESKLPILG